MHVTVNKLIKTI